MPYVEPGYAGTLDRGVYSQRYDPDVAANLQRQIEIARLNFKNAMADRANSMYSNQLNMMQTAQDAATPRVQASPFARAQNMIRF
jgi:hypothetical protein